jgi:hypothetical protein
VNDPNLTSHRLTSEELGEAAEPPSNVIGPLLGCATALVAALLVLRLIAGRPSVQPAGPTILAAAPNAFVAATRAQPLAAAAPPPIPTATPGRTNFANLDEASERLGFRVWQPTVLPEQYGYLSVAWQPESYVLVPGQRPAGVLRAWYWRLEHGAGLVLEQGPGIAVSAEGAPVGAHGVIALGDSRILIWVRGRSTLPIDPHTSTMVWSGDELRVGLPANGARPGWRLISSVLTLEDLLRVAEGLR